MRGSGGIALDVAFLAALVQAYRQKAIPCSPALNDNQIKLRKKSLSLLLVDGYDTFTVPWKPEMTCEGEVMDRKDWCACLMINM